MSTSSSTYSSTTGGSTGSLHQPAAIATTSSADGTVHHPGANVREGVAEIGSTVNHALASVAKGVGNALGVHHDQPAVVVTNHNPNVNGTQTTHCQLSTAHDSSGSSVLD